MSQFINQIRALNCAQNEKINKYRNFEMILRLLLKAEARVQRVAWGKAAEYASVFSGLVVCATQCDTRHVATLNDK